MSKGPKLNRNISKTRRDNLGLNGPYTSISSDLCPIINNVTPTVFYWIFFNWIYYDYINKCKTNKEQFDRKNFLIYLKKQDYYFILANYLAEKDMNEINGKDNIVKIAEKQENNGKYTFNIYYLKNKFGGLNYYEPGLISMAFIGESSSSEIDKGKELAKAFEDEIKDTEYYKKYRWVDEKKINVPKEVLVEYGKKMNITLEGFENAKKMFKENLLENLNDIYPNLEKTIELIKYLKENKFIETADGQVMRKIFYEEFSPKGKHTTIKNENLTELIRGWEIAMIRQYFTLGIEMMWSYLLVVLNSEGSMTKQEWIEKAIEKSIISEKDLKLTLKEYWEKVEIDFDTIQEYIENSKKNDKTSNLARGIKMMCATVKRLENRDDLKIFERYLNEGEEVSIKIFQENVKKFEDENIVEFLKYVLEKYIIDRHKKVANRKYMLGRDGYYYDYDLTTKIYTQTEYSTFEQQGLRLSQAYRVAERLEII